MVRNLPAPLPITPVGQGYAYPELRPLLEHTLRAGVSVLLRGHPGVGKSTLAAEVAAAMGLPVVDIRLAQRDPADLCGVYFPDRRRRVLSLFPPDWVRQIQKAPALVFLDEINAAVTRLHQAAAYQIVLERRVGPFAFHPGSAVLAAGNLEEDRAIVTPLSSALCNRFAHFILRADAPAWVAWGQQRGLHEGVLSYISQAGESALYNNSGEPAFPTPRSWEMASRLLGAVPPEQARRAVAACVGEGAASRLVTHLRVLERVPVGAILHKGRAMDFTRGKYAEASLITATLFAVAAELVSGEPLKDDELEHVVRFLRSPGLDPEHQFIFLRHIDRRPGLVERLRALAPYRQLCSELVGVRMELFR